MSEDHEKIHNLELQITEISADVKHIKERIDNGMSRTIDKIWNLINADIMPAVKDSQFWVNKIKVGIFWLTVVALGGGMVKIFLTWFHK